MTERKVGTSGAKLGGELSQLSAQPKARAASRLANHFNIMPRHPVSQACTCRFHSRLLGGKAGGQPLSGIHLGGTVADLFRSEDPGQKTLSKAFDRSPDPRDFGDINSCAYNHLRESKVPQP